MATAVGGLRQNGVGQLIKRIVRAGRKADISQALRLLMAQPLNRKLYVCRSEQRIVFGGVELDCPVFVGASC